MRRARGRPAGFVLHDALEAAVRVFWAKGYDAAPVDLLSREMGMPKASIYVQFGDKEGLFLAAIGHYSQTRTSKVAARLDSGGNLSSDLSSFFKGVIALATSFKEAPGCLVSCVLADAAGASPRMRAELAQRYNAVEERLSQRLKRARREGELPDGTDIAAHAAMLAAIARGITLQARAGVSARRLAPVARVAASLFNLENGGLNA